MSTRHKKKHLDFELNLIPFIDLLSVCICFLLITAVWMQIGSINSKQAVGGQAASETEKKPTLWMQMGADGSLQYEVKDAKVAAKLSRGKIAGLEGKPNLEEIKKFVEVIRQGDPLLTTALIQPTANSVYEDIIGVMDYIKKAGVLSLGVSPL